MRELGGAPKALHAIHEFFELGKLRRSLTLSRNDVERRTYINSIEKTDAIAFKTASIEILKQKTNFYHRPFILQPQARGCLYQELGNIADD